LKLLSIIIIYVYINYGYFYDVVNKVSFSIFQFMMAKNYFI